MIKLKIRQRPTKGKHKPRKTRNKVQAKLPQYPNTNHTREYQLQFDIRIQLDIVMDT